MSHSLKLFKRQLCGRIWDSTVGHPRLEYFILAHIPATIIVLHRHLARGYILRQRSIGWQLARITVESNCSPVALDYAKKHFAVDACIFLCL